MNTKIKSLAKFLEVNEDQIEKIDEITYKVTYEDYKDEKYRVCTDDEADLLAKGIIRDTLFAVSPSFILENSVIDTNGLDPDTMDTLCTMIKTMQDKECENCNEAIYSLLKDFDSFVKLAIGLDGRGCFISCYDGQEYDQDGYYIYRYE